VTLSLHSYNAPVPSTGRRSIYAMRRQRSIQLWGRHGLDFPGTANLQIGHCPPAGAPERTRQNSMENKVAPVIIRVMIRAYARGRLRRGRRGRADARGQGANLDNDTSTRGCAVASPRADMLRPFKAVKNASSVSDIVSCAANPALRTATLTTKSERRCIITPSKYGILVRSGLILSSTPRSAAGLQRLLRIIQLPLQAQATRCLRGFR
jgi:hypothetical protein